MGKKKEIAQAADLGIECLISGALPKADEVDEVEEEATPIGWIRITVERAVPNPLYLHKFNAREALIASSYEQAIAGALAAGKVMTDEEKQTAGVLLRESFEAQFSHVLATTPKYVVTSEEVWVAPPESSKSMAKEWRELAGVLGVEVGLAEVEQAEEKKE